MKLVRKQSHQPSIDPFKIALGLVLVGMGSVGFHQYYQPENVQIRLEKARLKSLETQQEIAEAERAMAERVRQIEAEEGNRRYAAGCQMIYEADVKPNGRWDRVVPLKEGMVIISPDTNERLGDGQYVCDHKFMTFEIVKGVTANGRRADDHDLVNSRFDDNVGWDPNVKRGAVTVVGDQL